MSSLLAAADAKLVQIAEAALADATRRSGEWLACRPGCFQCCVGVFPISAMDAERLRIGLLAAEENVRERIRGRVAASVMELEAGWPGDFAAGSFDEEAENFEEFGNGAVCPVLDPASGTCDLYTSRPMTCRTFGPPVKQEEGFGVCELCFVGAPAEAVAKAEMDVSFLEEDERLSSELGGGVTCVALALRGV
jgi:Fe-S-cluster containining protein